MESCWGSKAGTPGLQSEYLANDLWPQGGAWKVAGKLTRSKKSARSSAPLLGLARPKERLGFFRRSASEKLWVAFRETPIVLLRRCPPRFLRDGNQLEISTGDELCLVRCRSRKTRTSSRFRSLMWDSALARAPIPVTDDAEVVHCLTISRVTHACRGLHRESAPNGGTSSASSDH